MRRITGILAPAVLWGVGVVAAPAAADPPHQPGGPCIQPNQHLSLKSIYFYDDVVRELDRIEHKSRGAVTVESAGQSGEGRELLYATVGTGDTVFWIQGRIHGGERLGTQSALRLLEWLISGHPDAKRIRDELTVVVIPMYNPDGAEFVTAAGTRGIRGSVTPNFNLDLNRDWGPPPAPGASEPFAQPESIAWWHLFAEVLPNYALDYHHVGQAHVVQGTNDLTQFQIGHRPLRVDAFTDAQWRTNRAMSMVVYDSVAHMGVLNTTLYGPAQDPAFHVPNAVLSQMILGENAPPGAEHPGHTVDGALFFEFRSVGQKSSGMLVNVHLAPTKALLTAVADGSLDDYDISGFDDIPFPQFTQCGT
jgi:hypothetical protein